MIVIAGESEGATTEASGETDDDGKNRKFKNVKKWHEDFLTRLAALRQDVPNKAGKDYKTEMNRLDILKRIADVEKRVRDNRKNLKSTESRGEWYMKDLERRLNDAGRRAEPMRWRTIKCGLKYRTLVDCGLI